MSKAWPVDNLDPNAPLEENARRILRVRVGEYYSYEPVVNQPEAVEPLHDLRIAAKRLRYTLELFKPVYGATGNENISRVKSIQQALGDLHDTDVRIALIKDELVQLASEQIDALAKNLAAASPGAYGAILTSALRPPPDDPRRGLVSLLAMQYAERSKHYSRFKALWDQFDAEGMRAELVALSTGTRIFSS